MDYVQQFCHSRIMLAQQIQHWVSKPLSLRLESHMRLHTYAATLVGLFGKNQSWTRRQSNSYGAALHQIRLLQTFVMGLVLSYIIRRGMNLYQLSHQVASIPRFVDHLYCKLEVHGLIPDRGCTFSFLRNGCIYIYCRKSTFFQR